MRWWKQFARRCNQCRQPQAVGEAVAAAVADVEEPAVPVQTPPSSRNFSIARVRRLTPRWRCRRWELLARVQDAAGELVAVVAAAVEDFPRA